jgi:hypothetical protein
VRRGSLPPPDARGRRAASSRRARRSPRARMPRRRFAVDAGAPASPLYSRARRLPASWRAMRRSGLTKAKRERSGGAGAAKGARRMPLRPPARGGSPRRNGDARRGGFAARAPPAYKRAGRRRGRARSGSTAALTLGTSRVAVRRREGHRRYSHAEAARPAAWAYASRGNFSARLTKNAFGRHRKPKEI